MTKYKLYAYDLDFCLSMNAYDWNSVAGKGCVHLKF